MRCWGPTIDLPNQKRQSAKVFIERSHNIDQINEGKWMEGRKRSEFQMNIFGIDYELHKLVFCFSALLFLSQSTPHSVVRPLNYVSEVCASTSAVQLNLLRVRQRRGRHHVSYLFVVLNLWLEINIMEWWSSGGSGFDRFTGILIQFNEKIRLIGIWMTSHRRRNLVSLFSDQFQKSVV